MKLSANELPTQRNNQLPKNNRSSDAENLLTRTDTDPCRRWSSDLAPAEAEPTISYPAFFVTRANPMRGRAGVDPPNPPSRENVKPPPALALRIRYAAGGEERGGGDYTIYTHPALK